MGCGRNGGDIWVCPWSSASCRMKRKKGSFSWHSGEGMLTGREMVEIDKVYPEGRL